MMLCNVVELNIFPNVNWIWAVSYGEFAEVSRIDGSICVPSKPVEKDFVA